MIRKITCLLACLISLCSQLKATTITFDEIPFQSVNGLSFERVDYSFQIAGTDSDDAFYASFGPGNLTEISDPSLTGNSAGILTLDFELPTPILEFGVAVNTADSLDPGFSVELFDSNMNSMGTTDVETIAVGNSISFSESKFSYSGSAVSKAIIDFADAQGSFAFDNLVYEVPEPQCGFLAALFLALILSATRRMFVHN